MRRCPITPYPQAARDDSAGTCRSPARSLAARSAGTRATRLSKSRPQRRLRGNAGCAAHAWLRRDARTGRRHACQAPAEGSRQLELKGEPSCRPPRRVPAPAGQSGASSLCRNAKSDLAGNGAKMNQIVWRMSPLSVFFVVAVIVFQVGGTVMAHDNQIVNANIMTRVLHLKVGDVIGTGFTIEVDGRQYLITAKHLTGERDIGEIEISWEQWRRTKVSVVGMGEGREDIAVLSAKGALTQSLPIEVGSGGITVGKSVRFLGFPLGIAMDFLMEQGSTRLPLTKGGILSGLKYENTVSWLLVDGHNNAGYSGGPVVFKPLGNGQELWKIAGVISGYRIEDVDVRDAAGQMIGSAAGNSGILIATGIETALKLIASNPIGFPVAAKRIGDGSSAEK